MHTQHAQIGLSYAPLPRQRAEAHAEAHAAANAAAHAAAHAGSAHDGASVGSMPAALIDFIKEEADKDFQLQAGLSESVASDDKVWILSRARLPWLMVGLFGGLGSSILVSHFEGDISALPQIAFFMPVVAAMGGNAGVQSSAIIVQGLANNTLASKNIIPKLAKEFTVSMINGLACSAILLLFNMLIGHQSNLSYVVSVALITVIIFASLLGTIIPLILDKFKIDPALATGPFVTTLNDVVGLSVYFYLGRLMLGI